MSEMSRRSLLIGGSAAALGSIVARGAVAAPSEPMPKKWDETVDVLVVGSGFAGLACAIEARKAGASVLT